MRQKEKEKNLMVVAFSVANLDKNKHTRARSSLYDLTFQECKISMLVLQCCSTRQNQDLKTQQLRFAFVEKHCRTSGPTTTKRKVRGKQARAFRHSTDDPRCAPRERKGSCKRDTVFLKSCQFAGFEVAPTS